MSDPTTITIGLNGIVLAATIGIGGFFMWLLKRSVFGRMDEQDKRIADMQTKPICALMQSACQKLLMEKMDSVAIVSSKEVKGIDDKMDIVITGLDNLTSRIDKHINGHDHKG